MQQHRNPRLAGPQSKKFKFTKAEDAKLLALVQLYGENDWRSVSEQMLYRTARQCRERWTNYVNPELNKKPWSIAEDMCLMLKHQEFGNKWKIIQRFFPGRSKNDIKQRIKHIEFDQISNNCQNLMSQNCTLTSYERATTSKIEEIMSEGTESEFISPSFHQNQQSNQMENSYSYFNIKPKKHNLCLIDLQDLWPATLQLPVLETK